MITGLQSALDAKQATLSASAGRFLEGSTISSYTLRWSGFSVLSRPHVVQELHWSNYTVAQTIYIGTGKVELTRGHPSDTATQTWTNTELALQATRSQVLTHVPSGAVFTDIVYTHPSSHRMSLITGLQAQLNKISSVVDCVSGLSLGDAAGVKQKIACYESSTSWYTPDTYFYGKVCTSGRQ